MWFEFRSSYHLCVRTRVDSPVSQDSALWLNDSGGSCQNCRTMDKHLQAGLTLLLGVTVLVG